MARRAVAFVLDTVAFWVVALFLLELGFATVLVLALALGYFVGMPAAVGYTFGKGWVGIEIRAADGGRVGLGGMIGRTLTAWLLWLTVIGGIVDAIAAAGDRRRRSVHDRAAGTIVVDAPVLRR
jgi:uncharacterized RDD family membrane protein YckC